MIVSRKGIHKNDPSSGKNEKNEKELRLLKQYAYGQAFSDADYDELIGLRLEARQKLKQIRPRNFGQACRISGVSPADTAALMIYLENHRGGRS